MTPAPYALAALVLVIAGAAGGIACSFFMGAAWAHGAVVGAAIGLLTFAQLRLEDYLAERRKGRR